MKNNTRKHLTVLLIAGILILAGCPAPVDNPNPTPPDNGTTHPSLSFVNNGDDGTSLRIGSWSDELAQRVTDYDSGSLNASQSSTISDIAAGSYHFWIRLGDSDYKFVPDDSPETISLESDREYELTLSLQSTEYVWTLKDASDGSTLRTGSTTEFSDIAPATPSRIDISSDNRDHWLSCKLGAWDLTIADRDFPYTSGYFGVIGAVVEDMEIPLGSYDFCVLFDGLYHPLMKDSSVYSFPVGSNSDYSLFFNEALDQWTWTNQNTGDTVSGDVSAIGYESELPSVWSVSPSDQRTDVRKDYTLSWSCNYERSFDLYIDSVDGSTLVALNQTEEEFGYPLEYDTTYFWKIVAKNNSGETETPVYTFTTEPDLIPEFTCADEGPTNQNEVRIDIDFNVEIDWDSLTEDDFELTGGAVLDRLVKSEYSDLIYVELIMPDYDSAVSFSLKEGSVLDEYQRRDNISASLSFEYHHVPMGEICSLVFQSDSDGAWALDEELGQILYVDPEKEIATHSWDLPWTGRFPWTG